MNENIVKQTCKELDITQKELAERLGSHLTTIQKWAGADEMPLSAQKSLELVLENHRLKQKVDKIQTIIKLINELKE